VKFGREQVITIAALIAIYAAFYFCRANVDASLPLLTQAFGYDKAQLGWMMSIALFAYALGKLALGSVADWVGGWLMLLLVIAGSVAASFGIGAVSSLLALTALASLNRFFQAGGWCSVVEISSRRFEPARYGTVMGLISSSYEIGNVLALAFCSSIVGAGLGWRWLFVANPLLLAAVGALSLTLLRKSRRPPGHRGAKEESHPAGGALELAPKAAQAADTSVFQVFGKPTFVSALLLSFLLTFIRSGFLTWIPTFLVEMEGAGKASASVGILKSAVFPAAGMVGALAAGWASDFFGPGRRAPVVLICLVSLSLSVLTLGHGGIHNPRIAIAAIAGSGLFLLGPYSLVGGAVVLDLAAGTRPALISGILDCAGYVSASVAPFAIGAVAQRAGWARAFDLVAAAALASTLIATGELVITRARTAARRLA
jgi:sugar phosphate permease